MNIFLQAYRAIVELVSSCHGCHGNNAVYLASGVVLEHRPHGRRAWQDDRRTYKSLHP